ncbi:hypothetical protein [Allosphingosinicella deserti]|uniref:hypothetical protein n=1 Tax=Allosphingosinicella deserti TaxID=2116704 RepID=UPI001304DF63|nr:hypothetical protein [Sphingomonas deserti]
MLVLVTVFQESLRPGSASKAFANPSDIVSTLLSGALFRIAAHGRIPDLRAA